MTSQNAETEAPIDSLRKTLASCPVGPIDEGAHSLIERLLAKTWEDLHGSGEQQMTANKLLGRTEKLRWEPPVLSFVIERHGALVGGGSTRGELHCWRVNTAVAEATWSRVGHRQLVAAARPVRVDSLAEKIIDAIVSHENNPAVEWISATRIRVVPSRVDELKSGFKETVAGRRKRFVAALEARLSSLGWRRGQGRFVYELYPVSDG